MFSGTKIIRGGVDISCCFGLVEFRMPPLSLARLLCSCFSFCQWWFNLWRWLLSLLERTSFAPYNPLHTTSFLPNDSECNIIWVQGFGLVSSPHCFDSTTFISVRFSKMVVYSIERPPVYAAAIGYNMHNDKSLLILL